MFGIIITDHSNHKEIKEFTRWLLYHTVLQTSLLYWEYSQQNINEINFWADNSIHFQQKVRQILV